MPPVLTEQQKSLFQAAGLTPAQQAAVLAQTPYTSPVTSPIPVSTLTQPQTPLKITPPAIVPVPGVANIPVTEPVKPATPAQPDYFSKLDELTARIQGRESEIAQKQAQAAYPFEQELLNINKQIRMHQADALAAQEKALASGETLSFASGEAQRVARNDAIETFRLASIAESLQGNISLAEKHAKTVVDTEFGQVIKDINAARQNILNNYDVMTPAQKKRADITLAALNEKDAFVERQKEDRRAAQKAMTEAAQNAANFIPTKEYPTLTQALNAIGTATPEKAVEIITQTHLTKAPDITATPGSVEEFKLLKGRMPISLEELNKFTAERAAAVKEPKETKPEPAKDVLTQKQKFDIQNTIQANQNLLTLATQYKDLIQKTGFTSPVFGSKKAIGQIDALRGQITAAYKDAKKLGTLDIGVQNLVEQIIGERPVSIWKNIFGGRSKKIVSQLDTFIEQIKGEINQNKKQIGEAPQILNPQEREELEELLK